MHRNFIFVVGLSGLVASGCMPPQPPAYPGGNGDTTVANGAKPDWVDGTPARYPRMMYLVGVGRGTSRMPCENDARGALSKIFHAKIEQVSQDWMGHFSRVNATGKVHVEAMAVSQLTRVSTDYVLKGTKVAEVWKGPGAFHCLGVIDRIPAARTLRDEIARLDVQIAAKVKEGDSAPNVTTKFFAYKRAMELLQQREALNAELRIVDPNGRGQPLLIGWAELVAKFTGSSRQIKLGLKLQGTQAKRIQTCLAQQLTQEKIIVTETSNDVDLFIVGNLKWEWGGINNGEYMVKIYVNLRVMDMENGKTLAAIAEELKTSRPDKQAALQTATTKLCHVLTPRIAQQVKASLTK